MDTNSLVVVKHNKVIEACYQLTLSEQRILLACIAKIDSKAESIEQYTFEVTVSQIEDLAEIENSYRDVREASERLLKRIIKIDKPDPDKPNLEYTLTHWVDSCDYYPKEGKVVLAFSRPIIPYLSQLSHNFTKYKIKNVAKMKSTYSIRLYEWLCQWLSVGDREIGVDWLKTQWQLSDKYQRMSDLKKWVIDVAVEEVNEHSNLWVTYSQRKSGRTVTHFQFKFGLKNPPKEKQQLTEEEINRGARPGESRAAVIARLTGSPLSDIAKPGETVAQVLERKRNLADIKKMLR
jgi:plasmid replication initiation protein